MSADIKIKMSNLRNLAWIARKPQFIYHWVKHWKSFPVFTWLKAADYFLNKNFKLAAQYYRIGLNKHRNHPAKNCARMDYSYCLYRSGDLKESLKELKQMCLEEQEQKDCYLLAAKIYSYLGRTDLAITMLNSGLRCFPDDILVLTKYLHLSLETNLEQMIIDHLKEKLLKIKSLLNLDDNRIEIIDTALAHYSLQIEKNEDGEKLLARILASGKAPFEAVLLKGKRLLELGRIIPAREQLTRAMKISPRDPYPVLYLAESYLEYENFEDPEYALQLAKLACELSLWENVECMKTYIAALEKNYDHSTAELFEARCKKLISSYKLIPNIKQSKLFGEVKNKSV